MLCQSLNAEFASKGIHVVHIVIDGAVDAPDTLGKMLGPERAGFHLGAQIGDRALGDTSLKAFETGWRLGTYRGIPAAPRAIVIPAEIL